MIKLRHESRIEDSTVAYRLVGCPALRVEHRSAKILGALARMELGPVTCSWFSRRTGLKPKAALALLDDICAQGCAKRILIPSSANDSGMGELAPLDACDLPDAPPAPRSRLQMAYELLRRAVG